MTIKKYYITSLTWGFPITIIGIIVSLALFAVGVRPKRFGWAWCFEVGNGWGGLSLGFIILCGRGSNNALKAHEYGHSLQNCKYGIVMVFLTIASALRYWYYTVVEDWLGRKLPDYESSWRFESNATKLGIKYLIGENK